MRQFLLALLFAQLSACAIFEVTESPEEVYSYDENTKRVAAQKNWRVIGRIAVKQPSSSWLANIEWQHALLFDDIVIGSSLSGTFANVRYVNEQILVQTSDGLRILKTGEELQQIVGFNPPVNYLKYWVRGLVAPGVVVYADTGNTPKGRAFKQGQWQVKLGKYKLVGHVWLPHKVAISEGNLTIKLAVEKWLN